MLRKMQRQFVPIDVSRPAKFQKQSPGLWYFTERGKIYMFRELAFNKIISPDFPRSLESYSDVKILNISKKLLMFFDIA